MVDVTVPFTGWGRAGFGELAWGEGSVPVDSAEGQVGTVSVGTTQRIPVIGVEGIGEVGAVREIVFVTGVQGSAEPYRVLVWGRIIC